MIYYQLLHLNLSSSQNRINLASTLCSSQLPSPSSNNHNKTWLICLAIWTSITTILLLNSPNRQLHLLRIQLSALWTSKLSLQLNSNRILAQTTVDLISWTNNNLSSHHHRNLKITLLLIFSVIWIWLTLLNPSNNNNNNQSTLNNNKIATHSPSKTCLVVWMWLNLQIQHHNNSNNNLLLVTIMHLLKISSATWTWHHNNSQLPSNNNNLLCKSNNQLLSLNLRTSKVCLTCQV